MSSTLSPAAPIAMIDPAAAPTKDGFDLHFLQGGGEMGARMRLYDWASTPLGPAALWPQSLKTIVRVMLDSRYAMWMLWGPEYTFFCNDAYLPTVGIKREWVLGARSDKVWEEIWPDIGPRIEHVLRHGAATWDEALLLFLERSGFPEETYHTFSYSPVYDDTSRVAGMLCVVTEVTERVIGERRLRILSELAARAVGAEGVEASCDNACEVLSKYPLDLPFAALYLTDENERIARRVAFAGTSAASVLPEILSVDDPTQPWPLCAMHDSETVQSLRDLPSHGVRIAAGDWPDLVEHALLLPLKSATHGLAGFLIVGCSPRRPFDAEYAAFLDLVAGQIGAAIADAHAYEIERSRAESLAELDRAKTAFFSNVSHEFRTPLTLMLGPLTETLADATLPLATREKLELALRNATRLQRLVNSLLDFSRIEAGRAQASFEPVDLAALTRDIASTFRSAMEKAGLAFEVRSAPLERPVYVDHDMWEKVILNLVSNAFKFTFAGRVGVALRNDGDAALLEVEDTGIGIPAEELPRLFERFHRVESAKGRTHEGSGIGLALVQELVKLHGGTIGATSTPGVGTTLRVRIPYGADHLPQERVKATASTMRDIATPSSFVHEALHWLPDAPRSADVVPSPPSTAAHDRRFEATFGARVVLADDNADMRGYLRDLLAPYYAVETAADGEQALAAARREPPELVLSDVMMPRLDGFGLLAAIRADAALRGLPVVLLSARAGEESRIEGLDSGADDYVVKPFSARELLARIGALLELTRTRRSAERAAKLRTAQYETLLNESPLGVFLVDADFRLREANPTARENFANIHDLIDRDFAEVLGMTSPRAFAAEIEHRFRHTLATGEPYFEAERIGERLDRDSTEYYEWRIHRIPLADGRHGVVCYFRDVSAHVRARMQLEEADRYKDEFLAMLAHELRNPLAPIRNAGETLARLQIDDVRAGQAVAVVQRQTSALTRLVDDLLDVSRITRGRIELQRRPIELSDVIAQAIEMVEPLIREKAQRLAATIAPGLRVDGDPARLVQCVANVLTNAAKYSDRGGTVVLDVRAETGYALIAVSDDGIGIPLDLQPRVFDLFVQGERGLDRSQGGLGIGLSLVKRLVEMHGGSVGVHSEGPGRGSRFELRLPLSDVDAMPLQTVPSAMAAPRRRILVVDDNEDAANSLTTVLALDGHDVECAYDAEQALELAPVFRPDIALLDVGLPRMSGYELAQRLRAMRELDGVYLVALTGYGQPDDKTRAFASGFDSHLVKPAEFRALQEILERMPR